MTLARLFRFLLNGSDEQLLSKQWRDTMGPQHEAWTILQLDQGSVVKDVAACRRADFWKSRERPKLPADVLPFEKRAYM